MSVCVRVTMTNDVPAEVREKTSGSGTTEINDIITATRGK